LPEVAAFAIRVNAHLAHKRIVALGRRVIEMLAHVQASDASRVDGIGEIGSTDFLEGSRRN
jgi:hypothetical protein